MSVSTLNKWLDFKTMNLSVVYFQHADLHIPDSPTSIVWSVCSITVLATPMAFLILLRSATAPTSIVSLVVENPEMQTLTVLLV